jgi:hypothetical protein
MKTRLILLGTVFAVAVAFALDGLKAEKLEGDPLGFSSTRRPVASWQAWKLEHRLSGPVSNVCAWADVQTVQIVHALLHLRGPGDVGAYMKGILSGTEFVNTVPEGMALRADDQDSQLNLQALLKLKDGTYALLSVTDRWAVIEHRQKLGLILWRRPKPK